MRRALVIAMVCVLLLGCSTQITAKDIAKKMMEKYRSIKSFKAELITTVNGNGLSKTYHYEYIFKKPNEFYSKNLDTGDIMVSNGTILWIYNAKKHVAYYATLNSSLAKQFNPAEFYEKFVDNILKNYDVELIGTSSLNGRKCYILKLKPKNGEGTFRLWVDKEYWFPIRIETDFGSFRAVSEYRNLEFNIKVNDSIFNFRPPSGVVVKSLEMFKMRTYSSIESAQKHVNFTIIVPKLGTLKKVSVFDDMTILTYVYNGSTFMITEMGKGRKVFTYPNSTVVKLDGINATYTQVLNVKTLQFEWKGVCISVSTTANKGTLIDFAKSMIR